MYWPLFKWFVAHHFIKKKQISTSSLVALCQHIPFMNNFQVDPLGTLAMHIWHQLAHWDIKQKQCVKLICHYFHSLNRAIKYPTDWAWNSFQQCLAMEKSSKFKERWHDTVLTWKVSCCDRSFEWQQCVSARPQNNNLESLHSVNNNPRSHGRVHKKNDEKLVVWLVLWAHWSGKNK